MFNKIYDKLKKFIKDNYKELIVYIIIFIICIYPLPYYILIGGGAIDLNKRIILEGNEKGSYNLVYVKQIHATPPTYLLSLIIKSWNLESINQSKINDKESTKEIDKRERLYLEEANDNAIINAYKLAGKDINIKDSKYKVISISEKSDTNIQIGDSLISINNVKITNNKEYKEYLKKFNIGDKINVLVERNNKLVECYAKLINFNNEKIIGLYLVNTYEYDVNPKIKLNFRWNESGPSGGFMLSLAIYDRLIEEDLTKGRKIVGTGTIDINGNIGEIGGVKYKLMGAVYDKADIFFVPKENYEEAINTKKEHNYKIDVVLVNTLEDAVNYLRTTK